MDFRNFYIEMDRDFAWKLLLVFCAIALAVGSSDVAFAGVTSSDNDVIGNTLCRLVKQLSGSIARGIATIAIFAVGAGLFLGKLNWGIGAATAGGVGIIFSAGKLVGFLTGNSADDACLGAAAS